MRLPEGFFRDLRVPRWNRGLSSCRSAPRACRRPARPASRLCRWPRRASTTARGTPRVFPVRLRGKAMGFSPRAFRLGPAPRRGRRPRTPRRRSRSSRGAVARARPRGALRVRRAAGGRGSDGAIARALVRRAPEALLLGLRRSRSLRRFGGRSGRSCWRRISGSVPGSFCSGPSRFLQAPRTSLMVVFSSSGAWSDAARAAGGAARGRRPAAATARPVALLLCLLLLSLEGKSALLFEWLSLVALRAPHRLSRRKSLPSPSPISPTRSSCGSAPSSAAPPPPGGGTARGLPDEGRPPRPAPARHGPHGRPAARASCIFGRSHRRGTRRRSWGGPPEEKRFFEWRMRRPCIPYASSVCGFRPPSRGPRFRASRFNRPFSQDLSTSRSRKPPAAPSSWSPFSSLASSPIFVSLPALPRVVDYVDALAEAARQAANDDPAPWRRAYWEVEAPRLARAERRAADGAKVLFATTAFDAAHLPPGTRAVPNGVEVLPLAPRPRGPVVAFSGRLRYRPNVLAVKRLLDSIWPRVVRDVPEARLVLGGADAPRWLRARAGRGGVEVVSPVADMAAFLRTARVAAAPVALGTGTPNKLFEAFEAGAAVVASPEVAARAAAARRGAAGRDRAHGRRFRRGARGPSAGRRRRGAREARGGGPGSRRTRTARGRSTRSRPATARRGSAHEAAGPLRGPHRPPRGRRRGRRDGPLRARRGRSAALCRCRARSGPSRRPTCLSTRGGSLGVALVTPSALWLAGTYDEPLASLKERGGLLVAALLAGGLLLSLYFLAGRAVPRTVLLLWVPAALARPRALEAGRGGGRAHRDAPRPRPRRGGGRAPRRGRARVRAHHGPHAPRVARGRLRASSRVRRATSSSRPTVRRTAARS